MIRTPLTEQYFDDESFEQELATYRAARALRRGGRRRAAPRSISRATWPSYVNGIALTVDGGWLAEKSFVAGEAAGSKFLATHETDE